MDLLSRYKAWKKKRHDAALERTKQRGVEYGRQVIQLGPEKEDETWNDIQMARDFGAHNAFDIGLAEVLSSVQADRAREAESLKNNSMNNSNVLPFKRKNQP